MEPVSMIPSPHTKSQDQIRRMQIQRLQEECKFLRIEKELVVKMWENAIAVAHALRSALHTLLRAEESGQSVDEKKANLILESTLRAEIELLQERFNVLRSSSELREMQMSKEAASNFCSNKFCLATMKNVAEQLKEETLQLSQLQLLLTALDKQMKHLQKSRHLWQWRALCSARHAAKLKDSIHEWRHKARTSQNEISHLQAEIGHLREQSNTVLYHEPIKNLESAKREKIDKPLDIGSSTKISKMKKGNGAMIGKENLRGDKSKQHPRGENQRQPRCPLHDISNAKIRH